MKKKRITRRVKEKRSKIIGLIALLMVLIGVSAYIYMISDKPLDEPAIKVEPTATATQYIITDDIEVSKENEILSYIKPFYEKNNDTIGYIKIKDTQVDYPVLYSGDNEFYMDKNFDKQLDDAGAIFMDFRCDYQDFSKTRNIILYGHRMKDGSMFKELTEYLDNDFYQSHKIIKFDTLFEKHEWEVFAVFETDISFYYIDTDYPTDEKWLNFLEKCHGLSKYQDDIKFYPSDTVLTLSTCAIKKNKRFVVMARLKR